MRTHRIGVCLVEEFVFKDFYFQNSSPLLPRYEMTVCILQIGSPSGNQHRPYHHQRQAHFRYTATLGDTWHCKSDGVIIFVQAKLHLPYEAGQKPREIDRTLRSVTFPCARGQRNRQSNFTKQLRLAFQAVARQNNAFRFQYENAGERLCHV